jgi:sensor domain CHASE-containing protein
VALRTVETGKLTMQGPMILSQGYFGVVGRQPVFVSPSTPNETFGAPDGLAHNCSVCYRPATREQFWAFVNAVINFDPLFNGSDSRMRDLLTQGYLYRMYTRDKKDGSIIKITQVRAGFDCCGV